MSIQVTIDRDNTTLKVVGDIPMGVLLAYLKSEWEKPIYDTFPFPFEKLDYESYKLVEPWVLLDDTFNNIHGAGISTE